MADAPDTLRTTPLHAAHLERDARMMAFGGFDMPVQYTSIIEEHKAVRSSAGLFDVSHMGEVMVRGPQAFDFVQHLVTNDAGKLYDGRAMYTVMCLPNGGVVDDLLVYRLDEETYMLVINAANIEKDWAWMQDNNPMGADLENTSDAVALLAFQGPKSVELAQAYTDVGLGDIKFYHFAHADAGAFMDASAPVILSRTGYTGEPGLELYCDPADARMIWDTLLNDGEEAGVLPAGLGARDTLRLEAGYCLYGNDLTESTNPLEAGLGWVVKLDKGDFIGRKALRDAKEGGLERKLVGFVAEERGIPRHDYAIESMDGAPIGVVTSGSQSPMLNRGIGLGYVENDPAYTEPGQRIRIASARRTFVASVAKPPFHT